MRHIPRRSSDCRGHTLAPVTTSRLHFRTAHHCLSYFDADVDHTAAVWMAAVGWSRFGGIYYCLVTFLWPLARGHTLEPVATGRSHFPRPGPQTTSSSRQPRPRPRRGPPTRPPATSSHSVRQGPAPLHSYLAASPSPWTWMGKLPARTCRKCRSLRSMWGEGLPVQVGCKSIRLWTNIYYITYYNYVPLSIRACRLCSSCFCRAFPA